MSQNFIEVFIFNYNGIKTILSTIKSLMESEGVELSICVIDDHSNDGSLDEINKNYPNVHIHRYPYNTKKLNLLRNKALELSKGKYLLITDNDLFFDKHCLAELVKIMESNDKIATCKPRLMHWDQPEIVYTTGVKLHFLGTVVCEQRDEIYMRENDYASMNSGGGIFLIRREAALKVGGFDENMLMGWGDDSEFHQRLLRAGYNCLYVPSAYALHENKIVDKIRKYRVMGQTFNRWFFILSHYSLPLLILLIPGLILYELFLAIFVFIKGVFMEYMRGNFLVIKNFSMIMRKRQFVQTIRVVSDKKVLSSGKFYVSPTLIGKSYLISFSLNAFYSFLNFYWKIIKKIIP
jgi:GT2 family glycosyltransferase